jgi:hypothetical protein
VKKETMKALFLTSTLTALFLGSILSLGCSDGGDLGIPDDGTGPGADGLPPGSTDPAAVPPTPICPSMGVSYVGLGGRKLTAGRIEVVAGGNRDRIKPFGVLGTEFQRVASTTPTLLAANAATFGAPPARWYQEPTVSAVSLFTSYRVAFEGCLELTKTAPEYAAAPTDVTAAAQCTTLARKFWSRTPTPEEITACTTVATVDTAGETDVRRRWAYVCAPLLSSAPFLAY